MRRFVTCCCVALLSLGNDCTPPPHGQPGTYVEDVRALVFQNAGPRACTGWGEATLCMNGEKHRGSIEVVIDSAGRLQSRLYSPLGTSVASIQADSSGGAMTATQGTYRFRHEQTMDTLPFLWGRFLRFEDLVSIMTGRVPAVLAAVLYRAPDATTSEKTTINVIWKTDTIYISATIHKRNRTLRSISLTPSRGGWTVTLENFKKGHFYKVDLRDDDRNYFSINYDTIRT